MNNSFFTFLFLFFSFISFAQQTSIRGNVYDDETGETIIYANVYLDDETPRTTTDIEGFFSILNLKPGKHALGRQKGGNATCIFDCFKCF